VQKGVSSLSRIMIGVDLHVEVSRVEVLLAGISTRVKIAQRPA